jgi:raffinose/stachyose/melibiose transport system substrate-binding protein
MPRRRTTQAATATCLAALIAIAGCSSSKSNTASSTASSAAAATPAAAATSATAASSTAPAASTAASSAAPASKAAASTGPSITLNLETWSGAPGKDQMAKAIAGYEAIHPNIKIVDTDIASDDFKAKVPLALNSGQEIDVLAVQPNLFADQIKSNLLPVSDWQSDMPANTMSAFTPLSVQQNAKLYTDGKVYSIPFAVSGSAVGYYNVDILNKLGVQPPQTWADVANIAKLLKAKMPGVAPVVMPDGTTDSWFQDEFILTLVGQSDPTFFNNVRYNKGKWDTPSYVAALTEYQNLYKTGALTKDVDDLGYTPAMTAFFAGKAAMVFNGSWESTMLSESYRAANKINISNIGVIPVPAVTDPSQRSLRSFLDITMGIPKTSKHVAQAADFIAYISAGAGVNLWANTLGEIPAVNGWQVPAGVLGTPEEQAGFKTIQDLIANPHSDRNNLSAFSSDVGTKAETLVNGGSPAKVAAQMQTDLDSGRYN